ncbi:DMT family transporter [Bacillus thermocopriae]|uniref:DMT family transporter n=1 Tax=Neobacillus thermocopriae TaxID=1215031 RepID=A0A6B3TMC4_9BACI|nr:DMT family transporter [Neobacillus thermocopriae]MED3622535.1 DMT family transporter [Neobacillus thermocopriae]MED3712639.1 DMT family transporter [Neobacillus thermocopriae]NEX77496.1 DMT family transporter [Neobacillus thermocopriae]
MKSKNKGLFYGLFSGFTWALDTVLIGMVLSRALFMSTEQVIFLAPLVSTFLHDMLSSFWMMIYLAIRGELKVPFQKLFTRSGRWVMLGGLLGGPIGMTGYVLAVKYLGASLSASISAVYPAVGAFFAFILLKDRLTIKNWIGLFISILFIFLLGFAGGETSPNVVLGFTFILLAIFGWGMECVILAYGMKDDEISPEQALQIRQLVSAVTYAVIIMPIFKGYPLVGTVLQSSEIFLIAVIALSGTASYVYYYKAINTLGPTRAMALNISYSAWAILLSFLILGTDITVKLVFYSIMILAGSIITVATPEELKWMNIFGRRKTA